MYAVIETGGKQYRVTVGDKLEVERLAVEAGQTATFDRVLLVNQDGKVSVGTPTVPQAAVLADVLEHKRGEKKLVFKLKRRKGYRKTIGHRQELTVARPGEAPFSRCRRRRRGGPPASRARGRCRGGAFPLQTLAMVGLATGHAVPLLRQLLEEGHAHASQRGNETP